MSNPGNTPPIPEENEPAKRCPKCGGELIYGYGLMGGGVGAYVLCDGDGCEYFEKTQDGGEAE